MTVLIRHLGDDGAKTVATLTLQPDNTVEVVSERWEAFARRYVVFTPDGQLTIEDGEAWLRELPTALHGSRLWAESVREGSQT